MHIPPWLDSERRETVAVYADAKHKVCPCEWVPAKSDPSRWKLVMRKPKCVIHGAKGYI